MKRTFHLSRGPEDAPEEVRREIELHLELRAREFEAQGMSPEEARRAAARAFGDRGAIESEVRDLRGGTLRERRSRDWLGGLSQDLRHAVRTLVRSPGFTLVALLTLGLGIGANTAIFSVIRSVLLRPLPYPESDRLVQLWADYRAHGGRAAPEWLTPPDFADWKAGNHTFADMGSYLGWGPDLTGEGDPASLTGAAVSWNFLDVLGVRPAMGRGFTPADDNPDAARVTIISDGLWRRVFGARRDILERSIQLNGEPWTIVGVLPAGFRPPINAEIWRPARQPLSGGCGRGCIVLRAVGRLKPGVTLAQAKADLDVIAARIARDYPETHSGVVSWPIPLHEQITGPTGPALTMLAGAVLFVLLIGCVNLANLLLLRGAARARELSVRAALGAGRGRLLRQLLTEVGLLALLGSALGLSLGWAGSRVLGSIVPATIRSVQVIRLDGAVIAFTLALSALSAILFGLLPALHSARPDLMQSLRTAGREGAQRGRLLRGSLVVGELAIALMLLVGAGLLGRSFLNLQRVELGYRTEGLLTAGVFFPRARYAEPARATAAIEELLTRLRARPEVRGAEATDLPPLAGGGDQDVSSVPVGEPLSEGQPFDTWIRAVSPGYLQLMGMRLIEGRFFTSEDRSGSVPVGIVNAEAARRMWPGKSAVGRQLNADGTKLAIVGVVATAKPDGPNQPTKIELFYPMAQAPVRGVSVMVDPARDAASAMVALRAVLHEVDPAVPLGSPTTLAVQAGDTVALPRLYALLVGIFASAALGLAVLGVYGVMGYSVAQRQREFGVRLALGASPRGIRRLVLREGSRLTLAGIGLGVAGAVAAGAVLRKLLFGVPLLDAPTFAAVAAVLALMSVVACWLPARRAMRVDPLVAIREE